MNRIKYKALAFVLCSAVATSVVAEDLNKVIVIKKEIDPEVKESNKINVSPQVPPLEMKTTVLNYNDKAKTAPVPAEVTRLDPVANIDTISWSKYRGYAALGYFPIYNMGVSAGYRFIDKKDMKLGAWLQYNGKSYDGTTRDGSELSFNDHEISLNAAYSQNINKLGVLSANAGYTINSFSCPWLEDYTQSVNRFDFDAKWDSRVEGLKYNVEIGYDYFGYGKDAVYDSYFDILLNKYNQNPFEAVNEHSGYLNAGASLELDDNTQVALDFGAKMIHNNHLSDSYVINSTLSKEVGYKMKQPYNHAILTLIPHYDFKYENFKARVGVQLDYQIDVENEFNIAPDVYLDWSATSILSAYAHFTGGVHQNSMSSIFDVSHYFSPSMAYQNSKLPYVIDAGVNIGPFKNATLEIFGGYARANDWYMPCVESGVHKMESIDLDGWHLGVAASYNYKDIAKVRASYEAAPQSYDDGYYMWRDRAKYVVKASAMVTPISPLDITLDYEYRGGRSTYENIEEITTIGWSSFYNTIHQRRLLGGVSNLSVGGLYRYTDQISFFARLENILNNKYDLLYDIPAQGFTGLVGATYKF